MAGRYLGEAFFTISADTKLFRTQAEAGIRKAIAGISPNVRIGADTKGATAAVTAFQARVTALNEILGKMRADIRGDKAAEAKLAGLQAKVITLTKGMSAMTASADTKKLDAQLAAEVAKLRELQQQMSGLQADADTKKAAARIADLQKQSFHLNESLGRLTARVDITAAETKIKSIDAELRVLNDNARAVKLNADSYAMRKQIDVVRASIAKLKADARDIRLGADIDPAKLLATEAALLGIEHVVGELGKTDAPQASTAMGAFFKSTRSGTTASAAGWKLLTGHITLFGGALNRVLPKMFTSVAVWHLLADAVIETVAVWAPAIIAVTAFGVAGQEAAQNIFHRMQAVNTVMKATGQAVPPLKNNFSQLADSVRPQVYQLFGDALLIMNKRGGAFNQTVTGTGRALDQLAARFVFAVTSGSGVNKFMQHAVTDVAKLGDSIGNLGGIFGAVFRAVPGYAEILLTVGDGITKVLEAVTQAVEPVIAFGLALHGAIIYGGAAVTLSLGLVAGLVKLIAAFGKFNEVINLVGLNALKKFVGVMIAGVLGAAGYARALLSLARSEGIAATAALALGDAGKALAKIPISTWGIVAAVALAALVIAIARSKDEAQKFNDTMQQTIASAPLANVATLIQQTQAVTSARLADSTRKLNKAIRENTSVNAGRAGTLNSNGAAIQNLDNAQRHYTEGTIQLSEQQRLVSSRVAGLSREFGGNTQALGALNAAGITSAQIIDTNKDHWAQALIQVEATTQAYRAMGTQAGTVGNDLDVLGRTVTDQYTAVQKLNQAWGTFITDVTGTQGSFDTVAQGFFTLNDHAGKLTFSLGKLKVKYADQKAAIDSLTPAGIALNQAFGEQVGNLDKLFASWRTAGLAGNLFTAGVKDGIAPMVRYARGSQEATAQLVALAQEAGYQGPVSLAALTKWLGNTHGAAKKLKDITNQATTQEALLTGAMQAQGSFIASQLLGNINSAILAYEGVGKAVGAYGRAVAQSGKGSDEANAKMNKAIGAIVKSGMAMESSVPQMGAIVSKVFGISMPDAIGKVRKAMADTVAGLPPAQKKFELFAMDGMGLARNEADKLWKKFSQSNMGELAAKADTTRAKFDKLASKGLNLTAEQADVLWQHLRMQYLDTLATKTDTSKKKFEQLARDGLGLSKSAADALWKKMREQYLDTLANKSDMSKTHFEQLAHQMGITRGEADKLWGSLRRIGNNSPYKATVITEAKGTGQIAITGTGWALGQGNIRFHAAQGAYINAGSGPTADDVPAMLSRGEVVVPTAMVKAGAVDHLRGKLPGFAFGGLVGMGSQAAAMPGQARATAGADAARAIGIGVAEAMAAAKKAVMAAAAAAAGGGSGSGGDIVSYARSFLGKIPYAFGGTSLSGDDCSAFTSMVYRHFGYNTIPRTSEAQGAWVTGVGARPQAGGLAFYHSLGGGPDPGHVAIIDKGAGSVISQGGPQGVKGPKIEPLRFLPLLWTGIPPGGFHVPATGSGKLASGAPGAAQAWMRGHMGDYGWGASQWPSLLSLWNGESGWRWNAQNPASPAYGIPQADPGSKMASVGADWRTNPVTQMRWGAEYIRGVYGTPSHAYGLWLGRHPHWYGKGGAVKMAAGGVVADLRQKLAAAQAGERGKFSGLGHAFAAGPAKYRTSTVRGELATLAKHQAEEQAGYGALSGSGLTGTRLRHLGALARSEQRTAGDKALSAMPGGHPGFARDLRAYLGRLSTLSMTALPAGSAGGGSGGSGGGGGSGGSGAPVPVPVIGTLPAARWLSRLKAAQGLEQRDYTGLTRAYRDDLAHARPGSWTSGHRSGIKAELATLAKRQSAEAAAYDNILHHGSAKANLAKLGSRARAELTTSRDKDISGSHPGWTHGLQSGLAELAGLAVRGPATPLSGSQPKLTQAAFIARLRQLQAAEYHDYAGLAGAFKAGLRKPARGSWLYAHRGQLGTDLTRLRKLQSGEEAGYDNILHHGTSLANLQRETGRISPEITALRAGELSHVPGGHPGFVKGLTTQLKALTALLSRQPFNAPWSPGNLGASHTALGGVLQFRNGGRVFDRGGVLAPGWNGPVYNGTGRPEHLSPAGGQQVVRVQLDITGGDAELVALLRKIVRVRGGGNVQTALGRNHAP